LNTRPHTASDQGNIAAPNTNSAPTASRMTPIQRAPACAIAQTTKPSAPPSASSRASSQSGVRPWEANCISSVPTPKLASSKNNNHHFQRGNASRKPTPTKAKNAT